MYASWFIYQNHVHTLYAFYNTSPIVTKKQSCITENINFDEPSNVVDNSSKAKS